MGVASIRASAAERARPFPGDSRLPGAILSLTHAITVAAPPERVWPWLAQMGAGRGGWYSWDRIDNGGAPSAGQIVPALQSIAVGDVLPAAPGATDAFVVAALDPPFELLLTAPDGHGQLAATWEHVLDRAGPARTRLLARSRISGAWIEAARHAGRPGEPLLPIERVYRLIGRLPRPVLFAVAGLGHRFMEARHLRGIKRRAERAGTSR
jgi:hypothetical protein